MVAVLHTRVVISLVVLVLGAIYATIGWAVPLRTTLDTSGEWPEFTVSWSENRLNEIVREEEREVLLRFDQEISIEDLEPLLLQSNEWVESIQTGYDTLLFVFRPDVPVTVRTSDGTVNISLATPKKSTGSENAASALRLKLTKVRLLAQQGKTEEALTLINQAHETHPNEPYVLVLKAEIENQLGRWKESLELLDSATVLDTKNEDFAELRQRIQKEHGTYVDVRHTVEFTGNNTTERLSYAEGSVKLTPQHRIGAVIERNDIDANVFVRPRDGVTDSFRGSKYRAAFYTQYTYDNHNSSQAEVYLGDNIVGAGARHTWWRPNGSTSFILEYQRPFWEFVEAVVHEGTRDRIALNVTQRFTPRHSFGLTGALHRYGLDGKDSVMRSSAIEGFFSYAFPRTPDLINFLGEEGFFAVNYLLDAEYIAKRERRIGADGLVFTPLPSGSREVHAVTMNLLKNVDEHWSLEALGGFAKDRLGGNGPIMEGAIIYRQSEFQRLRFFLGKTVDTAETGDTVERTGVSLRWHF